MDIFGRLFFVFSCHCYHKDWKFMFFLCCLSFFYCFRCETKNVVGSIEILIFVFKLVWFLSSRSQRARHLHALDKAIKLYVLPEKHHMTLPESWNHHTPWRKTVVMESQTQTLVALVWGGPKMCLRRRMNLCSI